MVLILFHKVWTISVRQYLRIEEFTSITKHLLHKDSKVITRLHKEKISMKIIEWNLPREATGHQSTETVYWEHAVKNRFRHVLAYYKYFASKYSFYYDYSV